MNRYIPLLAMIFCFQLTMMAQKSNLEKSSPNEEIRVNREYDENGNLMTEQTNKKTKSLFKK